MDNEEIKNEISILRERSHKHAGDLQSTVLKVAVLESTVNQVLNERMDRMEKAIDDRWRTHDLASATRHQETMELFKSLHCAKGEICPIGREKNISLDDSMKRIWAVIILLVAAIAGVFFKR